jgi:TPR repeat protein
LLAVLPGANPALGADNRLDLQNLTGSWTLVTNQDETIVATGNQVYRQGTEVYRRVLLLKSEPVESPAGPHSPTETQIRDFIRHYRPPPIPYTSEKTAQKTGREKFNCFEFAEDIVIQAETKGIPAEVIGVKFKGRLVGHACAGFPTADGRMLYFDSTPGAGQVSHGAREARVELGKPYRRADGGELAGGVKNLPVTEIIPVSRLAQFAGNLLGDSVPGGTPVATRLVVVAENHLPVAGIEYARPDTLTVSEAQLERWKNAAEEVAATKAVERESQKQAARATVQKLAAKALAENEALAARGDVYGELRMGQRYLTGDGVAKDVFKARDYLQRAAEQGSQSAVDELDRLDRQ